MGRTSSAPYIGRFAPSPTGALHAGSLVAALASFLDAKAHQGRWLIRIEDVDETRSVAGADTEILRTLALLGMHSDHPVVWQSQRKQLYQHAFAQLAKHCYPCACSRREIADGDDAGLRIYPGTCRAGLLGRPARVLRVAVPNSRIEFVDRWHGTMAQQLDREVGDFVIRRADGFWAYQLAVVVDDGAQQITHVVRGADLLDSTARQIFLQQRLGLPTPHYLHVPLLQNAAGEKLSKQTNAPAIEVANGLAELINAARFLQLPIGAVDSVDEFWRRAIAAWGQRWLMAD